MGVYIDMEMPQNCAECFIGFCKQIGCEHYIGFDDYDCARHPDCPPIKVPEPHGRLGDLDALNEEVRLLIKENMLSRDDAKDLLETIADAPTVIPASKEAE